jgi:hypothetical protein
MKNSENTQDSTNCEFSISRFVCSFLKLGNGGKVDSFLNRVIKTLKKEIVLLKKNLDTLKFNYEQSLEELNDKLDDAKENLEAAFVEINVDRIATNESQKDYEEVYLSNIDNKASVVASIEKTIEKAKDSFTADSLEIEEDIKSRENRISIISEK